ncbi:MAG: DoxX family protein [Anaerolineales bacterium]|nr:MAG: DoxX family protein [Anaerolineales bacterium]
MPIVLWVAQVLLGIAFLGAGYFHAFKAGDAPPRPEMAWMQAISPGLRRFIGLSEIAGGLGVLLPMLTGILPWLTPLAATLLALVMLLAVLFHLGRKEYANLAINLPLLLLAAFVAWGRWDLFSLL